MAGVFKIKQIRKNQINKIKPLWDELKRIHLENSVHFKEHFNSFTFEERINKFVKINENNIFIVIAKEESGDVIGPFGPRLAACA